MRDFRPGDNSTTGDVNIIDKSKTTKKTTKKTTISLSIGSTVIIIGIVVIALFFFRSAPIEDKILGTWHCDEIPDLYLIFSENESLTVNRSNISMKGSYIFVEDNRLQLNFNFTLLNYVIYADVSVEGKTLSFDNIEDLSKFFFTSSSTTFKKVK